MQENKSKKHISVVELFAGVGGFRLGLEKSRFEIIWSNQWEPLTKKQHASIVYGARFGNMNHSNIDIELVATDDIPNHDLLCGGFPCQDYSVATTLKNSKGLKGKKGVLYWSIHRILEEKGKNRPKYLLLENVDRLLKSPSNQKGRDFAVMLQSLNKLGYAIEWRIINAADYGMPQRRRRVFILGYHKSSNLYKEITNTDGLSWIIDEGTIANAFSNNIEGNPKKIKLHGDLIDITNNFNLNKKLSPFSNTGVMIDGQVLTVKSKAMYKGKRTFLGDLILDEDIEDKYYIKMQDVKRWEYLKGAKKERRFTKTGFQYNYSEGRMIYPESLNKPSRTIITSEGGNSPSRFKHVIRTNDGRLRRLTPIELERLNMFPDDYTKCEGITPNKRAFFMGNALVVGVVEKLGKSLARKAN